MGDRGGESGERETLQTPGIREQVWEKENRRDGDEGCGEG